MINCPSLEHIENGAVSLSGTGVGSRATYMCSHGFTLGGNAKRICRNDGTWYPSAPICTSMLLCTEHNVSVNVCDYAHHKLIGVTVCRFTCVFSFYCFI